MQHNSQSSDIAIIGAGIIGICAAAQLAEIGRGVTVFDRTGICEETSSGNAAAFAFSDVRRWRTRVCCGNCRNG
jgi:D-amino-acid dehydrogenase